VILGLKAIIAKNQDIEILAITENGEDTLKKTELLKPNVLILDIDLPGMSGIEITEKVVKDFPYTKIILHTSFEDVDNIVRGFEAGAVGYVPKTFKTEQLIEAIRVVAKGEKYIKGTVSEKFIESYFNNKKATILTEDLKAKLTTREVEILRHISDGHTNQETADQLDISVRTVEVHKHNIMKKLELYSTAELVKYALRHNIVSL
jgi:DNA-binding NarL/FixJ family response regulator